MIEKLEMFLMLAREQHFGRAAEKLNITQPSLSAALRQLEDQLGTRLVLRGSRYQGLTPEGEQVRDWARRIVTDARTMREELRAAREGLTGTLRLAVIPTALSAVTDLTAAVCAAHPAVRFSIVSCPSSEALARIADLSADAAITYLDNDPLGRVTTLPLFEERYVLVCRDDADGAGRSSVAWADLGAERLCLLTPDMQNRRILDAHLAEVGVAVRPELESSSTIVLISHVGAGGWSTILPERAVEPFTGDGRLCLLPIVQPDVRHSVGLVLPLAEPRPPLLAALLAIGRRVTRR